MSDRLGMGKRGEGESGKVSRFDRYMLSQLMMLFGFFSLILISVYWVNRAVALFDELISDGQSAWVFLEFTALTLPNVIRLVLPVSAFVAAVYVTNRLSSESELVVMQATGFSPMRLARPVVLFGVIVGLMIAVLVHVLVPASRTKLAERKVEIAQNVTSKFLDEGAFLHPAQGITFYIREITETGEMLDVFLSDDRVPGEQTNYTAERAILVKSAIGPKLLMFEGLAQTLEQGTSRLSTTRFDEYSFDVSSLAAESGPGRPEPEAVSTIALLTADPDLRKAMRAKPGALRFAGHERFAQSLIAVVAALIGFATLLNGGFSRFGLWRQMAAATAILIFINFLVNGTASIVENTPKLWPLVYVPSLIGFAIAWMLLIFAGRARRVRHDLVAAVAS